MCYVNYKGFTREASYSCVGPGWARLIDEVFDVHENLNCAVNIIQVKEKWGGLRIYTDYGNSKLDAIIKIVEADSFTICEECGSAGVLRKGNWYRTLCDIHANGREPINGGDNDGE